MSHQTTSRDDLGENQIIDAVKEISQVYTEIEKIFDYQTGEPYQDADHYVKSCFGGEIPPNLKDSILSDRLQQEWYNTLSEIKEKNKEFINNTIKDQCSGEYAKGYLDGFKTCDWLINKLRDILTAPIITSEQYGNYIENGLFENYFLEDGLAYPNEIERQAHFRKTVEEVKSGNFNEYYNQDDYH